MLKCNTYQTNAHHTLVDNIPDIITYHKHQRKFYRNRTQIILRS